jgi:hypothetical protein
LRIDTVGVWGSNPHAPTIFMSKRLNTLATSALASFDLKLTGQLAVEVEPYHAPPGERDAKSASVGDAKNSSLIGVSDHLHANQSLRHMLL